VEVAPSLKRQNQKKSALPESPMGTFGRATKLDGCATRPGNTLRLTTDPASRCRVSPSMVRSDARPLEAYHGAAICFPVESDPPGYIYLTYQKNDGLLRYLLSFKA
jgi:hypothetical protein